MGNVKALNLNSHNFDTTNPIAKKKTLYATIFTFVMMVVEIIGGVYYNSMALLADGWHISSHVLALGLAFMTYVLAQRYANDARFNFGTYKIEVLGGYTSAVLLLVVAFFMAFGSFERMLNPVAISYKEAIIIAVIGLVVNLICAWLLKDDRHHDHYDHHDHSHDMNLKAAYIHVLSDALTSVLAIVALIGGMFWDIGWLDSLMGIIGSIVVFIWAVGLIKQSGKILLDAEMDAPVVDEIIDVIQNLQVDARLRDLHVWRVGRGKYSCIISLDVDEDIDAASLKKELEIHEELVHISVEINKKSSRQLS
jgi:cation diffusion facilitator family transporter